MDLKGKLDSAALINSAGPCNTFNFVHGNSAGKKSYFIEGHRGFATCGHGARHRAKPPFKAMMLFSETVKRTFERGKTVVETSPALLRVHTKQKT
jgi:hypothetical protein